MAFNGYDVFRVIKKYQGDVSNYSMSNLYMPLIGVDSYSMYFLLASLDNNYYMMSKLMDHLNFGSTKLLDETIKKLEGIGLVETYVNKDKEYLFLLNEPLSYNEFMSNHILVEFLKGKIGLTEFNKIIFDIDLKGYKNITHGFDDIYERTNMNIKNVISPYFKSLSNNIQIKNDKFDYTYFKLKFDNDKVSQEALDYKKFKEEILRISYHYNLNEDEMYEAVMMAIRIEKDLRVNDVLKYAQKIYSEKSGELINFKGKETDPFIFDKLDSDTARFVTMCDNISSEQLLKELSGIKPALSELKMIEELSLNTGFPQGVINFMILLVNSEKNGELPPYSYFEKVANTWKRANVKTTIDAINLVYDRKNGNKKSPKNSGKTIKEVPDWYSDYEKKIKEASNGKDDSQVELTDAAKKLFSSEGEK